MILRRACSALAPSGRATSADLREGRAMRRALSALASSGCGKAKEHLREASILVKSPDWMGIVSAFSDCVVQHGSNMTGADLHVERGRGSTQSDTLLCRFSFQMGGAAGSQQSELEPFEGRLAHLASKYRAGVSLLHPCGRHVVFDGDDVAASVWEAQPLARKHVVRESGPARMGVLLSGREHCLNELVQKCQDGDLPVRIPFVISNHQRSDGTSNLHRSLTRLGVPHYFVDHGKHRPREEWEAEILDICSAVPTDFLVLARYMQIISSDFLQRYGPENPIINIHHGLLPSFKGANPYGQAYAAGVKLIGATAHFVTEDLDEGPIIAQRVETVSHRDSLRDIRIKSETLEAMALHDAVRSFAFHKVLRLGGRTVVFP